jgi:hypothetical protein
MTCLLIKPQLCLLAPRPRLSLKNLGDHNVNASPNSADMTKAPDRVIDNKNQPSDTNNVLTNNE